MASAYDWLFRHDVDLLARLQIHYGAKYEVFFATRADLVLPDGISEFGVDELPCNVVIYGGGRVRGGWNELVVNNGSFEIGGSFEFALRVTVGYNSMSGGHRCGGNKSLHEALRRRSSSAPGVVAGFLWRDAIGQFRLAVTSWAAFLGVRSFDIRDAGSEERW